jgi:signal transduction histidine kinase
MPAFMRDARGRPALEDIGRVSAGPDGEARDGLEQLHRLLSDHAGDGIVSLLSLAHARARSILETAGRSSTSIDLAAGAYAAEAIVALAAEGELEAADTRLIVSTLATVRDQPVAVAALDTYARAASTPALLQLPPIVTAEILVKLLLHLDVASQASVWHRSDPGTLECLFSLGMDAAGRSERAAAQSAIAKRGGLRLVGRTRLRAAPVLRFGTPVAAIVIRAFGHPSRDVKAYLVAASSSLAPALEREYMLKREADRERALMGVAEKRLMRLGFDLHDGPIQDVLALAAETRYLRDQIDPFVLDTHRELAYGRFEDILARLAELDRTLRATAHSLETKSIVSRPLGEILHREVEAFGQRAGIEATLEVRGDPDSLNSAQRVTVFRAVQESLANVREHSRASSVAVFVRARRNFIDVRVTDDGQGFEVGRALARAAQHGRLGLVGIGERVRMLGGVFDIDSRPGGPTIVHLSLPRSDPFVPTDARRR